ncbi:MAG: hypothetical protein Q8P80_01790 [Candidatus Levybacteria bacterium]|nr:hypothetical protein [Candidatus Levybacteria bacterium]
MENLKEKFNLKFLLAGFLVLIFISGIVFLSISTKPKAVVESEPNQNPLPTKAPDGASLPQVSWKIYQNNEFKITYPSDWKIEKFPVSGGGEITRIKFAALGPDDYYPSIDITPEDASTAAQLEGFYASLGFSKTQVSFTGMPATKYAGLSTIKAVGKKIVKGDSQESAVFIKGPASIYYFEYRYDGSLPNQDYESIFGRIINSLEFL